MSSSRRTDRGAGESEKRAGYLPDVWRSEWKNPFKNWRQEILAFFSFLPILVSNGFVEGKNNRTKAMMRQAYGYRNPYNLRMRILLEAGV